MNAQTKVSYLVFDVEAIGNGKLIRSVLYPDETISADEAIAKYRAELLEVKGKDVLPATFVLPISVAVAKVSADFQLLDVTTLDDPDYRPDHIVQKFWSGWRHYKKPVFVTFNGRGYDLPRPGIRSLSIRNGSTRLVQGGWKELGAAT